MLKIKIQKMLDGVQAKENPPASIHLVSPILPLIHPAPDSMV